jgi:hypothetical protein
MEGQRGALRGPGVDRHGAVDVPHQQVRIEVLVAEFADPAHPPATECVDHLAEFPTALAQRIGGAAVDLLALHHPRAHQRLEPFRQQRRRHLGNAAAQIVEMTATQEQFANHQHRPPFVEQLHRLGDRTELAVSGHHDHLRRRSSPVYS